MQFLKIENMGTCDVELFTVLGTSTTKDAGVQGTLGAFGSGVKMGILTCLRNKLNPIIFTGNRKLDFFTRPQDINDGIRSKQFERVCVKFSGKDTKKTYNSTEDLGFVLDYGSMDWTIIPLALREFVSNSIDRSFKESENQQWKKWLIKNQIKTQDEANEKSDDWQEYIKDIRPNLKPWQQVVIELVDENQVRAQKDKTRVFVPINDDVYSFQQNLGRYFLHFREESLLNESVLPKRDRNLTEKRTAVIFKRGVRVREVSYPDTPSLFDYNLNELRLDESRTASDWEVKSEAGRALAGTNKENLAKLMLSWKEKYWEHTFDSYSIEPSEYQDSKEVEARSRRWQEAFRSMAGDNAVITTSAGATLVINKGYESISAPENYVNACSKYGIKTVEQVLTQDDIDGRIINEATPTMIAALNYIWETLNEEGLTFNKTKPEVKGFKETIQSGQVKFGFYRDGVVYLNDAFAPTAGYAQNYPSDFLDTVLHELAHHISGGTDGSNDFEKYIFKVAIHFLQKRSI